jgi:hypothetical protein
MKPTYTVIDCAQRSPEWYAARIGRLTGSCAADAIAFKVKGGETEGRRKLRDRLVVERLVGHALDDDTYVSRELQRGIDMEGAAAGAYEAQAPTLVRWSGFLSHNTLMVGCSLDGHVGDPLVGIIEIKCPKEVTHYRYLRDGIVPEEYEAQALHNLWVSGAQWLDFVSFDDRFPEGKQLFVVRVERDNDAIAAYAAKALTFLEEVQRDYAIALGHQWQDAASLVAEGV